MVQKKIKSTVVLSNYCLAFVTKFRDIMMIILNLTMMNPVLDKHGFHKPFQSHAVISNTELEPVAIQSQAWDSPVTHAAMLLASLPASLWPWWGDILGFLM